MNLKNRIIAFKGLGEYIGQLDMQAKQKNFMEQFKYVMQQASTNNEWFTPENILFSLKNIAESLTGNNLDKWLSKYPEIVKYNHSKNVALIMAGNIPLVGFHDLLSVLIAGHKAIIKLSSKDDVLLKGIAELLYQIEPEFQDYIHFTDGRLKNFDAVIATGSNNSAQYFEYYFGKYPNIIRKNRNSVAVLTGKETEKELKLLAEDIFRYFGLGCRNVSKIYIPDDMDLDKLFKAVYEYKEVINHNKYANNYTYNRSVYLMNKIDFFENGFMILKEDMAMSSPISVVFYERYSNLETVKQRLSIDKEQIQCVVSQINDLPQQVYFGEAQKPKLWDYADNVDTLEFLLSL
ncbi:MAG: hypothetical protein L3J74_03370 [Bacteroidales bacterium]|nr:hypothetical protein [Bacteroidales bacterium]